MGCSEFWTPLVTTLSNVASNPAQPQYQNQLAQNLNELDAATTKLKGEISPSQFTAIKAMGGGEFFDPSIAEKVRESVQKNAMTPAVARDFVQDIAKRRTEFLSTVRNATNSLGHLGVAESTLEAGAADVAFLIPREMFDNKLGAFAKELTFINRLVEHYTEAITGTAEPAVLEQLSSSIPTVALFANLTVIGTIAAVVNKFLTAWEKIEKIRKMRGELKEMGMKGQALEELTQSIETTVEEVLEESTQLVLVQYHGTDAGRRNELESAIRQDTKRLFGQIERGLSIEFRANKEGTGEDSQRALTGIDNLAKVIKFPQIAKEPMLLDTAEVIEGELQTIKHTKKTTTTQKTTRKGPATTEA